MWPSSSVLIVINTFIFSVHTLPSNFDWNYLHNDSNLIVQNEKILKLYLQLATHTANRLMHLRKKIEKGYDCNKHIDNPPISTIGAFITQSPSQTNLEWLDKKKIQKILNHSSSGDPEINSDQNQIAFNPQLQELSNLQNIDNNRDIERSLNSKMSNLIPKFMQDIRDTSSDITGYNHEFNDTSDILQKPILDSDTLSNSLNANEFRPDFLKSIKNDVNEKVNQNLIKNNTNTSIMNDLTEIVNKFFPNSQNLQESTLEISQRLFDTDLAHVVPKISNVYGNANQHIPLQNTQNTRASSDKNDNIRQRFFDPITNTGNNLNTQTDKLKDNLPAMNQTLSSTKNIVESMIKVLPEIKKKDVSNLLNQVILQSQDINTPLKVVEESQKQLAQSVYTQQEQSKNVKQENQFDANASGRNNQELTRINENSIVEDSNKQYVPMLSKDSSVPLLRFLSDFKELENNNKTDFPTIETNENANSSIDEELIRDHKETEQSPNQINEEVKAEEFKKINETRIDYSDGQLNPISEDLSQKSKENELTDVAIETSTLPNQLESNTLTSIAEYQTKRSIDIQDSENGSITKPNLEEARRIQDISSVNDRLNQSIDQITHINDNPSDLNSHSFINDLEDLNEQLSETKLQEISDRLINALRPIEKRIDNNRTYVTDHIYSK